MEHGGAGRCLNLNDLVWSTVESVQDGTMKHVEDFHSRERKSVVPILPEVFATNGIHYLPLFSTDRAAVEKFVLKEMVTEN